MQVKREPAMVIGVVSALSTVLVAYGFLTVERAGAWMALLMALIPLAQAFITRSQVMPVSTLKDAGVSWQMVKAQAEANNDRPDYTV